VSTDSVYDPGRKAFMEPAIFEIRSFSSRLGQSLSITSETNPDALKRGSTDSIAAASLLTNAFENSFLRGSGMATVCGAAVQLPQQASSYLLGLAHGDRVPRRLSGAETPDVRCAIALLPATRQGDSIFENRRWYLLK